MIAEISPPGVNLDFALSYNFEKVEKSVADILCVNRLSQDKNGQTTFEQAYNELTDWLQEARIKHPTFHVSLNPHPNDKLSDAELVNLAHDYMKEMGYAEQPFIVFKHRDIERTHVHVVSIRVDSQGNKIPAQFERVRSKEITARLEERYNLTRTQKRSETVEKCHGLRPIEPLKGEMHAQMKAIIGEVFRLYDFTSVGELDAILRFYGMNAKETTFTTGKRQLKGIVFLAVNKQGKPISPPMTGKELGKGFSMRNIRDKMKDSKKQVLRKSAVLREQLFAVLAGEKLSRNDFQRELSLMGIKALFRENQERIYGVTFVSERDFFAINGSDVDRALSGSFFNRYFSMDENDRLPVSEYAPEESVSREQEFEDIFVDYWDEKSILGELINAGKAHDYKEEAWQRKLRRKSKKRKL